MQAHCWPGKLMLTEKDDLHCTLLCLKGNQIWMFHRMKNKPFTSCSVSQSQLSFQTLGPRWCGWWRPDVNFQSAQMLPSEKYSYCVPLQTNTINQNFFLITNDVTWLHSIFMEKSTLTHDLYQEEKLNCCSSSILFINIWVILHK